MEAYTFSELTHTFRTLGDFLHPLTKEPFGLEPVNKLYRIANAVSQSKVVPQIVRDDAHVLTTTIHLVNGKRGQMGELVEGWLKTDTTLYKHALHFLLEASMYMRGWEGPGTSYPIQEAPHTKDEERIEIAVGNCIREYNLCTNNLVPSVNDLPLFYHNGKTFTMSTCDFEGKTIGERIDKVLLGERTSQMSTCIRLSSNWLVSSAYYYLQLTGNTPSFNIADPVDIG